jgi:hypothetical protein
MTISGIDESQRAAAKVVGFVYLFAMATSIFAELYARGQLIVPGDVVETARNIMAHERLFRLSIACHVITFAADVALITALYVVLRPVNRNLALFAAFLRMIETSVGVTAALHGFDVLRFLSGAEYLRVFEADRLQALARLSRSAHGAGLNVCFVFLGLGSTVFGYLWFKSGYIPKALAALGVFASLLLATTSFVLIIFPELAKILSRAYMAPIFVFEVTTGLWLLFKGLPRGQREATG